MSLANRPVHTIFLLVVLVVPWGFFSVSISNAQFNSGTLFLAATLSWCVIIGMNSFSRTYGRRHLVLSLTLLGYIFFRFLSSDAEVREVGLVLGILLSFLFGLKPLLFEVLKNRATLTVVVLVDLLLYFAFSQSWLTGVGVLKEQTARGIFEYQDVFTPLIVMICVDSLLQKDRGPDLIYALALIITVFISGSRLFQLVLFITFLWLLIERTALSRFIAVHVLSIVGVIVAGIYLLVPWICDFTYSLSPSVGDVCSDLRMRIIDPGLSGQYRFDLWSLAFGFGPDMDFYIPWFEYRGLEPYSSSLDSTFSYLLFKFGLPAAALFAVLFFRLSVTKRPYRWWLPIFLLLHNSLMAPGAAVLLMQSQETRRPRDSA